jgi:hypothetical protein
MYKMAVVQIPNLPTAALGLTGAELLEIVQAGVSCRTTSQAIANLAPDMTFPGYWASYYSSANQTNSGALAVNKVSFNNSPGSYGITVYSNSQITVSNSGVYNIQFIANVDKTDGGADQIDFWLMKNNSNVVYSNSRVYIPINGATTVVSLNFTQSLNANDYLEIAWASADVDMFLYTAAAGATIPAIPSASVTVQLIREL